MAFGQSLRRGGGLPLFLVLVVIVACGGAARATDGDREQAPAVSEPPSPDAVVFIVQGDEPDGLSLALLTRHLYTYLQDVMEVSVEAVELARAGRDMPSLALEIARRRGARFALWYVWEAGEIRTVLTVSILDASRPEDGPFSLSMGCRGDPGADFYRDLAIKLRGILRATVIATSQKDAEKPEMPEMDEAPPADRVPGLSSADIEPGPSRFALELILSGAVTPEQGDVWGSGGVSLGLEAGEWLFCVEALQSLPDSRRSFEGVGRTTVTRLSLHLRRHFPLSRLWSRLSLWVGAGCGAVYVRTSARLLEGSEERLEERILPVLSISSGAGVGLSEHVRILCGPSVDIFPLNLGLYVRGTEVFATGWILPGFHARILLVF